MFSVLTPGPKARMRLYALYILITFFYVSIFFEGPQLFRISESSVLYDETQYADILLEALIFFLHKRQKKSAS